MKAEKSASFHVAPLPRAISLAIGEGKLLFCTAFFDNAGEQQIVFSSIERELVGKSVHYEMTDMENERIVGFGSVLLTLDKDGMARGRIKVVVSPPHYKIEFNME